VWIDDEYLRPFADLVEQLSDLEEVVAAAQGARLHATRVGLELPVEMGLVPAGGTMLLGIVPPTQRIESAVMPVFHQLRLVVTPLDDG
jgi:hypothetical protein